MDPSPELLRQFDALQHPKKRAYLRALARCGEITRAAKAAGIDRTLPWYWRQEDPAFTRLEAEARDVGAEVMVAEAYRRAIEGVEEPVYYQGQQVDRVRKYSDLLLMFLLKGARPQVYRDTAVNVQHSGTVQVDLSERLASALERARARRLDLVS